MSFGWASTAAEVAEGIDLSGTRAVVTGASSGIGIETARALAGTGAEVTLAVRDTAAGERVAAGIEGTTRVARLDLADQDSSPRSPRRGTVPSTCSSTTRASWRCPSSS